MVVYITNIYNRWKLTIQQSNRMLISCNLIGLPKCNNVYSFEYCVRLLTVRHETKVYGSGTFSLKNDFQKGKGLDLGEENFRTKYFWVAPLPVGGVWETLASFGNTYQWSLVAVINMCSGSTEMVHKLCPCFVCVLSYAIWPRMTNIKVEKGYSTNQLNAFVAENCMHFIC